MKQIKWVKDMDHLFGEPGPISMESLLNHIFTKTPSLFGLMYRAGEKVSAVGVTSPVYLIRTYNYVGIFEK